MWNRLYCCLSGGHDYSISSSSQTIFLRCVHCGKRSNGWELTGVRAPRHPSAPGTAHAFRPAVTVRWHVLPFSSQRASQ
jgi:hypothetical protein